MPRDKIHHRVKPVKDIDGNIIYQHTVRSAIDRVTRTFYSKLKHKNSYADTRNWHRLGGPAEISYKYGSYWINGELYTKEEFDIYHKTKDRTTTLTIAALADI